MTTENDRKVLNSILNPNLPLGEGVFDPEAENTEAETEDTPEDLKILEREGMKAAEEGNVEHAIDMFTKAITKYPKVSSCYNNRAQALRLAGRIDDALEDLNKAITVSEGKGKAAANAFCQRGILYRKNGQDDDALKDFNAAAALGSGFAKSMLVEMNPYAAMCNAMLRNVFSAMATGQEPRNMNPTPNTYG